jgi:potassium-dependent mechanosensitive channel
MKLSSSFGVLVVIVLLAGSTCASVGSQAAVPPATAPAPQSAAATAALPPSASPAPIQAANIALEAQSTHSRLRRIRLELDKAVRLSDVESRLDALTSSLQRIHPELEAGDITRAEQLINFRQELRRFKLQLEDLQKDLTPRSRVLEGRREELHKMELLWDVTLQSLSQQEAEGTSRELIRYTQNEIADVESSIRTYRPVLLTIQNRLLEKRIAVDDLLAQTDDAIDQSRARLLTLDREPLWRVRTFPESRISVADSIRSLYSLRALPLFEYLKDNKSRLWVHLLVSLLLLWLLTAVSREGQKWLEQESGQDRTDHILRHPLAATLVLTLLLSVIIYPEAPVTLYRLPLFLMVFPLLRVVSGTLTRAERAMSCYLAVLFLLRLLVEFFAWNDLAHRILVLVLTGMALFGAVWSARLDRRALASGNGLWRRARMHLMRLCGLILAGSLVANIVGGVTLATLTANACINSAYAGAAIFAGVLAFEGFLLPVFSSPLARRSPAIREHGDAFRRHGSFLVRFVAVVAWAGLSLSMFGLSAPILGLVSPILVRKWAFGGIAFSLGGILLFVATIWISVLVARFVAFFAETDILSRVNLPQGMAATVAMLLRDSLIAFGFVLALAGAGVQWSQMVLVASAIGLGIGFGLQNLVASFIAGIILIVERPIRVGDVVEIGTILGVVSRVGLRSSTIQAYDGSEAICPNSNLISKELVNWTLSNQVRRVEVKVRVVYGSDPDTVLTILKRVAIQHPGVLPKPEPTALFKGFGESSLDFVLRFFTSFSSWSALSSEVGIQVSKAFQEAGIEIPFSQRDILITRGPAQSPDSATNKGTPPVD